MKLLKFHTMSLSSSSSSNKEDIILEKDEKDGSSSSAKQRYSAVYQYYTFDDGTSHWNCDYCE